MYSVTFQHEILGQRETILKNFKSKIILRGQNQAVTEAQVKVMKGRENIYMQAPV